MNRPWRPSAILNGRVAVCPFVRIRGSEFYRSPVQVVAPLWAESSTGWASDPGASTRLRQSPQRPPISKRWSGREIDEIIVQRNLPLRRVMLSMGRSHLRGATCAWLPMFLPSSVIRSAVGGLHLLHRSIRPGPANLGAVADGLCRIIEIEAQ